MSQFSQPNWGPPQGRPAGHKPRMQQTSTAAIVSLVLGLISFCALIFTGLPAIIVGAVSLAKIKKSQGALGGSGLAIGGIVLGSLGTIATLPIVAVYIALLLPAVQQARVAAQGQMADNQMKQIGIAVHNYADANKHLPSVGDEHATTDDPPGQKLSWRVHLLPYLGYNDLYQQFHLDESWDSPHNSALITQMPDVYKVPGSANAPGHTRYLAIRSGANTPADLKTALLQGEKRSFREIVDGTSNTAMILIASPEAAVEWTRPEDFDVDYQQPRRGLPEEITLLFVDGSVREAGPSVGDETLRAIFFANDGQMVKSF